MQLEKMALHTDKYQINMMYAHWKKGAQNKVGVFDTFFRELPFGNGYAVFAGLQRIINYINNLRFTDEDIAYLARQDENYDREFLKDLKRFRFTGEIRAVEEGALVFPNEPIIQVKARNFENKLVETPILNFMYQTLVATKASRIKQGNPEAGMVEFGTRRAHETAAALWGARAAYLAGFDGTSNVKAGEMFGIPTKGTHSHAWVMDYDNELQSFIDFIDVFQSQAILLVDTYDTLKSGVPNAIKAARHLEKKGGRLFGIRLDSGDLAQLSIRSREMLDRAGLNYVKIVASSDLDEYKMASLIAQGARIDIWAFGTQLITCADSPAMGCVYKLVAKETGGELKPTIKISSNPDKVTLPGHKNVYRIISKSTDKAEGDYITEMGEKLDREESLRMFDPVHTWMYKYVTGFDAVELLKPVFCGGEQVYQPPSLEQARVYHQTQLTQFWPEYLRQLNPAIYPVVLSDKLWHTKMNLLKKHS